MQLSLVGLDIKKAAGLEDFFAPGFYPILSSIYEILHGSGRELFLHGDSGSGKTHLLSAIYRQTITNGQTALLLSLPDVLEDTDALLGLDAFSLVLLDDIHLIKDQQAWQEALFHFINRVRSCGTKVIYTANIPANELHFSLLDLLTRLGQIPSFALPNGNNASDRQAILEALLAQKGWQLPNSIKSYFVEEGPHLPGDMLKVLSAITPYFHYKGRKLPQKLFDDIKNAIKTQSLLVELADIPLDNQSALPFDECLE